MTLVLGPSIMEWIKLPKILKCSSIVHKSITYLMFYKKQKASLIKQGLV